ncbi:hypothetical protein EXN66_Car015018 [Channa argus]|uniref:Uncharacterized protein n=1 Tax=Channa argus TaxID=215402 RepID=A0A6G1Q9M1_CHAAH|nr:hypothetical protein EXN66_Car015018 [Channa argus]KAK2895301.1 hypothetical protein Q8A73_014789 [Channa argus]
MAGQDERCCKSQHSVAVILLLLSLAPGLSCFNLQRMTKKVQQDKIVSEPAVMGIKNGHVIFNGEKLGSQSGSSSSAATDDNGLVHVDSIQSDGPEMMLGQTLQLETAVADEAAWRRLKPTLLCGLTKMKLKVMGPGAAHLQLDTGNAHTLPLIQVPKTCGYSMQQNALGLILVVPYNGCRVLQKNGFYVLPMSWLKTPVKFACPMLESPNAAATTTAQPTTTVTPTTQPSPEMNPPQYPYPYFPYYPSYPLPRPHRDFRTTVPPATTTTATPTTQPSPEMNPPQYPYPYFPYYPSYPLPRPHWDFRTTVPPATTTTTATPTTQPFPEMNPPQYPYPYFPYYPSYPLPRPHRHFRTTVPPATTTTTATPTTQPSPEMNPPQYPYPYFPYYPSYPLPRPHRDFRTTVPPATTTTTATPTTQPSHEMNPPQYPYPYFPYYPSYPLPRPHREFRTTVPPTTTATPTTQPSPEINPPQYPYPYFPYYPSYPLPRPHRDFKTTVPPSTTTTTATPTIRPSPEMNPLQQSYPYFPYYLYYPYDVLSSLQVTTTLPQFPTACTKLTQASLTSGPAIACSNTAIPSSSTYSSPTSQFLPDDWYSFSPYMGHRNNAGTSLDAWKHGSRAGYQSAFQSQAYPQSSFLPPQSIPWFSPFKGNGIP